MVDDTGNVISYPTMTSQGVTITYGSPATTTTSQSSGPSTGEGSISGVVTADSEGLAGVCVYAYGENGITSAYSATTDANGGYDFDDVVPGEYAVEFDPTCGGTTSRTYALQFYDNQADPGTSSPVSVTAGQTETGIDAELVDGSAISGTVEGPHRAVAGACVYAYSEDGYYLGGTETGSSGVYSIGNLPADSYVVEFDPTCATTDTSDLGDAIQFYGDEPSFGTADLVQVETAGETVDDINADLVAGATISGTVTAPGAGADNGGGICVTAYTSDADALTYSQSNADSTYSIGNLPGATYCVLFDPTCGGTQASDYSSQWYSDESGFAGAKTVTVPSGGAGIDATLSQRVGAPSVTTTSLPSGSLSSVYLASLQATGGSSGYTWTVTGLPSGLSYSPGGVISGTPTSSGTFTVIATATDSSVPTVSSQSSQLSLSITASSGGGGGGGGGAGGGAGGGGGSVAPTTTTTTTTTTTVPSTTSKWPLPPGTPAGTCGTPVTATVSASGASLSTAANDVNAKVSVPAGALPVGTTLGISLVTNPAALDAKLPPGQSYLVSFAVSWVAPNGTVPAATTPITMTITDPSIKAGDTIYILTASGRLQPLVSPPPTAPPR
jgi:hypothetical protein